MYSSPLHGSPGLQSARAQREIPSTGCMRQTRPSPHGRSSPHKAPKQGSPGSSPPLLVSPLLVSASAPVLLVSASAPEDSVEGAED